MQIQNGTFGTDQWSERGREADKRTPSVLHPVASQTERYARQLKAVDHKACGGFSRVLKSEFSDSSATARNFASIGSKTSPAGLVCPASASPMPRIMDASSAASRVSHLHQDSPILFESAHRFSFDHVPCARPSHGRSPDLAMGQLRQHNRYGYDGCAKQQC